jgi:hypothetical protein
VNRLGRLATVVLVGALAACTSSAPTPSTTSTSRPTTTVVTGSPDSSTFVRHAASLIGYVGGTVGSPVSVQFVFIDTGIGAEAQAARADPVISGLQWVTERGAVAATVNAVTSSAPGPDHRIFTVSSEATVEPGEHSLTAVRFRDEAGLLRDPTIGEVLLDAVIEGAGVSEVRFAILAPYLDVRSSAGEDPVVVPLQLYLAPFGGEQDLRAYIATLPRNASYGVGSE